MSVQAAADPLPAWAVPPPGGFTADDLDRLPDLPQHTQLIDGSLVFASPQNVFHSLMISVLGRWLFEWAPKHLRPTQRMTVTLGRKQRPEPDVLVVHKDAITGLDQSTFPPEAVELAVEVVSPDSEVRDRERKPQLYAGAGIPHFWRVENNSGVPTVYVYELDPATRVYALTGIHHDRLKLTVPFDIDIDLTEIHRR